LDIGAGCGTYADLLANSGYQIDAVEIFSPYLEEYNLKEKYNHVFVGNVLELNIDFSVYDLIILGDVVEHMSEDDSYKLLSNLLKLPVEVVVAVPFNSPQGEVYGNIYEAHLQSDLNLGVILKKYKNELIPLCVRYDYGVFIKNSPENNTFPIFTKDIDSSFEELLKLAFVGKSCINTNDQTKENHAASSNNNVTIVTGLWNLGRGNISDDFKRPYSQYKQRFADLLKTPSNMVIFVAEEDEEFIWEHRSRHNTFVKIINLTEFKAWFEFYERVQTIRTDRTWYSQAGWLENSPQATLPDYNPVVMSKMFLLNNATFYNPFSSEYFFWIDAGITNTVHSGYFYHDKVFDNLPEYIDVTNGFLFLSYPYEDGHEIHGFPRNKLTEYARTNHVKYVCRGGFFGGKKENINALNGLYYHVLNDTLSNGYMGTEESIFTIISHTNGDLITRFDLQSDGLVWPFFESLKSVEQIKKQIPAQKLTSKNAKVILYVLGYNSPDQFELLCQSFEKADSRLLNKTKKVLINNSTDISLFEKYDKLCEQYAFEEIHLDNIGICGGRQYIAEHFDSTSADFYMFFEDDMTVNSIEDISSKCKSGLIRYVPGIYNTVVDIIIKENFDFLKMSFSEFYGTNNTQWAWYNVPQSVREEFWPNYNKLPEIGLDPNAPKVKFDTIETLNEVSYISGEIYYSNWPQIVSREGNKKMFLTTKWDRPFEQTWMSYIFQETKKGNIKPGILLASPITHDRFAHYPASERKEN
jgi:hypothetical protein